MDDTDLNIDLAHTEDETLETELGRGHRTKKLSSRLYNTTAEDSFLTTQNLNATAENTVIGRNKEGCDENEPTYSNKGGNCVDMGSTSDLEELQNSQESNTENLVNRPDEGNASGLLTRNEINEIIFGTNTDSGLPASASGVQANHSVMNKVSQVEQTSNEI